MTGGGTYRITWSSRPHPIPENEPFELSVRVARADGAPLPDDVVLHTDAWMPAHKHGMVRRARTTRVERDRFTVQGMLLHMSGEWKLTFDLSHEGRFEHAEFDVALVPPEAARASSEFSAEELARVLALSPLPPPPDDPTNAYDTDERAAHFGRFLFFDARLSGGGTVSCASCHVPERDWTDGKQLADVGTPLERNTMSLWNAAYARWFFWDGRADSQWSQALHPLEDPREHGADRVSIVRRIAGEADLRRGYESVFGALPDVARLPEHAKPMPDAPDDPLAIAWQSMSAEDRDAVDRAFTNVGKALAAFQRELVSRSAPFDDFVEGLRQGDAARVDSLSPSARRGLKVFVGKGNCDLCHSGPNFSDREFHNNRVPSRDDLALDLGRSRGMRVLAGDPFNGRGRYSDGRDADASDKLEYLSFSSPGHVWGEFKTPSLRNVAKTAPYMHQGQLATLADVVDYYSDVIRPPTLHDDGERVLAPLHLSDEEKRDLVAFLESLTDTEIADELRRPPAKPYADRSAPSAGR